MAADSDFETDGEDIFYRGFRIFRIGGSWVATHEDVEDEMAMDWTMPGILSKCDAWADQLRLNLSKSSDKRLREMFRDAH